MFTTYQKEENFLNQQPFMKDEVKFNLMHRIVDGELAIALRAGDKAIALQNKGFPMVVWVNKELSTPEQHEVLNQLYQQIKSQDISVITSKPDIALYLAEKFAQDQKSSYETKMNLMSYHCLEVKEKKNIGKMRLAEEKDFNTIVDFCVGFILDGFNKKVERESQIATAKRLIDATKLYVLEVDNEVVSMAYIAHQSQRHSRINYVYTPPKKRGKGYASSIMTKLSKKILNEGSIPVLFTDLSNPISNRVYKNIGYTECGALDEIRLLK